MKNLRTAMLPAATAMLLATAVFAGSHAKQNDEDRTMTGTVLITGANRGLGFHFAQQFARAGWRVIATTRNPGRADELQAVAAEYPQLVIERLDITDDAEIAALVEKYRGQPIDVLLNNAARLGEISRQNFGAIDFGLFQEILETNVIGTMKVTEAFAGNVEISEQKKIVTMGSVTGTHAMGHSVTNMYAYRSSKAALHFAMRHLSLGLKDRGIAVVLLEPGFADSRGVMTMKPEDAPDQETRELVEMVQKFDAQMRDPAESVAGMIQVIGNVSLANSGQFLLFDGSKIEF